MVIRTKKSKYFICVLLIICLTVAFMAPAVNAIAGVDDAAIAAVVASCAMFGVDWAVRQGAQALSQADIFSTVREKLVASGWSDSDFQMVANGVKHPAQGIFSLGASAFRKITEFVSGLDDEIDNSGGTSITVGNVSNSVDICGYNIPLPPGDNATSGGHYVENACNIGVWTWGADEDKRVNNVGLYSQHSSISMSINARLPNGRVITIGQFSSSHAMNDGNAHTLYCDFRYSYWGANSELAYYCNTRANWNVASKPTTSTPYTLSQWLSGDYADVVPAGVSLNVRKVTPDKPLPELELLPDTGEVNISTGLSFTDNNGLIDAIVNAVNGTGSYVPVYDYSQDINDLTTSSNGILGNTTGILSGVQSIAGTLTEVLTAVKSIVLSAFDFLASLPGYLASFAGKFAGIWHYVVSWVGSLGSWLSVMFSVWNGLPYAMVVPVYASAVIVLVVFIFKRFFG